MDQVGVGPNEDGIGIVEPNGETAKRPLFHAPVARDESRKIRKILIEPHRKGNPMSAELRVTPNRCCYVLLGGTRGESRSKQLSQGDAVTPVLPNVIDRIFRDHQSSGRLAQRSVLGFQAGQDRLNDGRIDLHDDSRGDAL